MTAPARMRVLAVALALLMLAAPLAGLSGLADSQQDQPTGMTTIPGENVRSDLPANTPMGEAAQDLKAAGVLASDYASTTELIVTSPGRAENKYSGGTIQGGGPLALVITDDVNHDGRQVAVSAAVLEDILGYRPPMAYGGHESGELWKQPIKYEDGWAIIETPKQSENTITFAGTTNITASPAADGSTIQYDLTDADSASNFNIEVTGRNNTHVDTDLGSVAADGTLSTSISGTEDPVESNLTLIGKRVEADSYYDEDNSQSDTSFTVSVNSKLDRVDWETEGDNQIQYEVWLVDDNYAVKLHDGTGVGNGAYYTFGDHVWDNPTIKINNTSGVNFHEWSADKAFPKNVTVTIDGTTYDYGDFSANEEKTKRVALTPSDDDFNLGGDSYTAELDYNLTYTEVTHTVDPAVSVNGHWTNYTGSVTPGNTVTLTTDTSWVQGGTNEVNVNVGDGTLSAEAPTPQIDLDYSHDSSDEVAVAYDGEHWRESYNVSYTFANDKTSADLTIPFEGTVLSITSIDYRINGTTWTEVDAADYSLSNTQLTVDLDAVYGGSIPPDTTMSVRTDGRKVTVHNASMTVVEPTTTGNKLDSKVRVDAWASDSYIALNDSPDSGRIHYTYNEDWTADEYLDVSADGTRHLELPAASGTSEFRISTIPVSVDAVSGDVHVSVDDPQSSEPVFQVQPGDSDSDSIKYTFEGASGGEDYVLYSVTHDVVRDSGTAQSPLTLEDDDSEETLQFQLDTDSTDSTAGGGGGGGLVAPIESSPLDSLPAVLIAFVAVNVAVYYLDRRRQSLRIPVVGSRLRIPGQGGILFVLTFATTGLLVLNYLSDGALGQATASVIESTGESVGPLAGIAAVGLTAWYLYRRFIRGQETTIVVEGEQQQ